MKVRLSWAGALALPLTVLTGCFGPPAPNQVAQDWLRAVAVGDGPKACQMSLDWKGVPIKKGTPAYRQCLSSVDGNFTTRGGPQLLSNLKQVKVTSAQINDDTAVVTSADMTGVIDPVIDTVKLRRVRNYWYVIDSP